MKLAVEHAGLSEVGRVRAANEDAWMADPELGLHAVSDGMGGKTHGSLASTVVVTALPVLIKTKADELSDLSLPQATRVITDVVTDLSARLSAKAAGDPALDGMGATLVLALVRQGRALISHMGDSHAYLYRAGRLERLTADHSMIQLLLDGGDIDVDGAAAHPARGKLTRYVGMPGRPLPETRAVRLMPGDRLLLCSDGLSTMVGDDEVTSIMGWSEGVRSACDELVATANEAGGRDNATAFVIAVQQAEADGSSS